MQGKRRDKLVALEPTGHKTPKGDPYWNCVCDCGNFRIVSSRNFRSKKNLSCKSCAKAKMVQLKTKHGFGLENKTYKAWCLIKRRCLVESSPDYPSYGGIGITVHPSYVHDFMAFYKEIGEAPEGDGWSIDRIDNSKGYEPGNIRWADRYQQARNKGMFATNTSGFTGATWDIKRHPGGKKSTTYAIAIWTLNENGISKQYRKAFSTKKLGLLEAFAAACAFREAKIAELRLLGYDYSENHGKH